MVEHDSWEKKEDLENAKEVVVSQNKLLTYLWYLNLGCTLRGFRSDSEVLIIITMMIKINTDNKDKD